MQPELGSGTGCGPGQFWLLRRGTRIACVGGGEAEDAEEFGVGTSASSRTPDGAGGIVLRVGTMGS